MPARTSQVKEEQSERRRGESRFLASGCKRAIVILNSPTRYQSDRELVSCFTSAFGVKRVGLSISYMLLGSFSGTLRAKPRPLIQMQGD